MANQYSDNSKVSEKEKRFCEFYLVSLNGAKAARQCGYSKSTAEQQGWALLRKVRVAHYLSGLIAKRSKATALDAEYVLNGLMTVAERCMSAEAVLDAKGNETGEWKFNATGANKAFELLGRYLALFVDVQKHDMTDTLAETILEAARLRGNRGQVSRLAEVVPILPAPEKQEATGR